MGRCIRTECTALANSASKPFAARRSFAVVVAVVVALEPRDLVVVSDGSS